MNSEPKKPGDGLRQLARMVIDDNIPLRDLDRYLQHLLTDKLMEFDSQTRQYIKQLPELPEDLSPDDVAFILRRRADEIEQR